MSPQKAAQERAERLSRREDRSGAVNHGYTRFVRVMRLALPLAAAVIVLVVFLRLGGTEDRIAPVEIGGQSDDIKDQEIAHNELLNPRFESVDHRNQSYEIVAKRAVHGAKNKDLIMLERPEGVMRTQGGAQVKVRSDTGAYRQDTERFFLEGGVVLEHTEGYRLTSSEAHIDMQKNFAWSEKDVQGSGPDIRIDAKGLQANGETGEVVFIGPARLVLETGFKGFE